MRTDHEELGKKIIKEIREERGLPEGNRKANRWKRDVRKSLNGERKVVPLLN
jgi:hypothetical protein